MYDREDSSKGTPHSRYPIDGIASKKEEEGPNEYPLGSSSLESADQTTVFRQKSRLRGLLVGVSPETPIFSLGSRMINFEKVWMLPV